MRNTILVLPGQDKMIFAGTLFASQISFFVLLKLKEHHKILKSYENVQLLSGPYLTYGKGYIFVSLHVWAALISLQK